MAWSGGPTCIEGQDTHDIVVGADMNSENITGNLVGDMDELRFYNRALIAVEVGELAQ